MAPVLEGQHIRPNKRISGFYNTAKDTQNRLCFSSDPFLALIIKGPVEAVQIDVDAHSHSKIPPGWKNRNSKSRTPMPWPCARFQLHRQSPENPHETDFAQGVLGPAPGGFRNSGENSGDTVLEFSVFK